MRLTCFLFLGHAGVNGFVVEVLIETFWGLGVTLLPKCEVEP